MAKVLTTDEMLDLLTTLRDPDADVYREVIASIAGLLKTKIANFLAVRAGDVMTDMGGVTVAFSAIERGDTCPQDLERYDPTGEFDYRGVD